MESIVQSETCRWLREREQVWSRRSALGAPSFHFRMLISVREASLNLWSGVVQHTVDVGARSKAGILRKRLGAVGIGPVGVTIALGLQSVL